MPVEVIMPKVDMDMTTGTIAVWHVDEGAAIEKGAPLFDIETDKATMEVESPATGALHFVAARDGDVVEIGACVGWIFSDGESVVKPTPDGQCASDVNSNSTLLAGTDHSQADKLIVASAINDEQPAVTSIHGTRATPLARRIARQQNIDLQSVKGTGPRGRITRADVEAHTESVDKPLLADNPDNASKLTAFLQSEGIAFDRQSVDRMRQTIASRLTASKATVPHFYLQTDCRVEGMLDYRRQLNSVLRAGGKKISVNDLLVRACAQALVAVPDANASWDNAHLIKYRDANVAIAVSVDGGVVTPVIRQAQHKLVDQISAESATLIERARQGDLKPAEYQGGSFTLSNLGMYDVKSFSAIINPPQSMILAVGSTQRVFLPDENDNPFAASVMSVVLSCDHRIIDGVLGAKWLAEFKRRIEHPVLLGMYQ